jgi:hypothetical protein
MTPHLYRATAEGRAKAAALTALTVTVDVRLSCGTQRLRSASIGESNSVQTISGMKRMESASLMGDLLSRAASACKTADARYTIASFPKREPIPDAV